MEYAEPDTRRWPMRAPNDQHYSGNQWHLKAPTGDAGAANLPQAWDITTGSDQIVVAVIDTGALNHIDLDSRFVGGSASASGRDFITEAARARDGDGRDGDPTDMGDWADSSSSCTTSNSSWHGTHVAGTIGAETDNNLGAAGVDWQAKLLTARALGECGGTNSDITDAILWSSGTTVDGVVNANPARVLNLSLGGTSACSTSEQTAIDAAVAQGAVVVVAAGNEAQDVGNVAPANCNQVIAVAALTQDGARASFSNYGTGVAISAPGVSVWSASNSGTTTAIAENGNPDDVIGDLSVQSHGTSMATPHVSGVVSLMLAANQAAGGDLMAEARKAETAARIKAKLQASARAFPTGTTGTDCTTTTCGAGMLDAHQAVVAVSTAPTVTTSNQYVLSGVAVTLSADAADDAYNGATTWRWTQTSGTTVTLNNVGSQTANFTAPSVDETLTFSVTATDDTGLTGSANVDVQVSTTEDRAPDAFGFTDQTGVASGSAVTSNTITVSGINTVAAISVTGGEYSVNGGAYTSAAGTVNNGDTVTVRHTHSAGESTRIDTVVTIGGVSATFSSVTASATNGGGGSIGLWLLAWLCLFVGVVPLRRRFR